MVDLLNATKNVQNILSNAISASNTLVSVAGTVGIAGFVFDIADDETVELDSDITDHYVENGTAIQDHIALRPERVTVRGLVGEYRYIAEDNQTFLEKATKKLTTLASYLPPLSDAATAIYKGLQGKNESATLTALTNSTVSNISNTAMDLFKAYRNVNLPQTEQQKAFIYFEALRNSRSLFTIQTPFRYYTDMAIENIKVTQSGFSRDQSEFEISFKKIRFVDVDKKMLSGEQYQDLQGRLEEQGAEEEDMGMVSTKPYARIETDFYDLVQER